MRRETLVLRRHGHIAQAGPLQCEDISAELLDPVAVPHGGTRKRRACCNAGPCHCTQELVRGWHIAVSAGSQ